MNIRSIDDQIKMFQKIMNNLVFFQRKIQLILQKMNEYDESNNNDLDEENEDTEYKTPQIFIERLIRMRNKGMINDQAIRDQVHLVIFGGQDTSSYTIAMTLLLLAMHPHIEQRVMDEIESVVGDSPIDADVTMDQVTQLTYLEQTIKEVQSLKEIILTIEMELLNICVHFRCCVYFQSVHSYSVTAPKIHNCLIV